MIMVAHMTVCDFVGVSYFVIADHGMRVPML